MKIIRLIIVFCTITLLVYGQNTEVINGHAHNDYKNKSPLMNALHNGFMSVEADVFLIDDELYVSHTRPGKLKDEFTLEAMYLKPLKEHIEKNHGCVYDGYSGPFYLMIDFKTKAKPTYKKLKELLSNYRSIISVTKDGIMHKGPVTVFISGNRPFNEILTDEPKLAGIDGRPSDLDKNIPASVMPVVSDNYHKVLSWRGKGKVPDKDINSLALLVQKAHAQNKKVRLWGGPDKKDVWKFLLDNGVDLINTDLLKEFREFYLKYEHN